MKLCAMRMRGHQAATDVMLNVEDAVQNTSPPKGNEEPLHGANKEDIRDVITEAESKTFSNIENEVQSCVEKEQVVNTKVEDAVLTSSEGDIAHQRGRQVSLHRS